MEKRNNELINKEYLLVMAVCHAGENVGRQGTVEEQMCHAAYLCEKVRLKQYRYIRAASATTIAGVLESDQTERLQHLPVVDGAVISEYQGRQDRIRDL